MVFDKDEKILKELVIIKKICIKLLFGRSVSLNKSNHCELKTAYIVNHKYNIIKIKEENIKAKAKQLKNKK